jgi:hypothetical protein
MLVIGQEKKCHWLTNRKRRAGVGMDGWSSLVQLYWEMKFGVAVGGFGVLSTCRDLTKTASLDRVYNNRKSPIVVFFHLSIWYN